MSKKSKERLKQIVRNVVVSQGNRYIKELLRDNKLTIGATKADFMDNLLKAIDGGYLSSDTVEAWLAEIEGWGNQHIYLFEPLAIKPTTIEGLVGASPFKKLLNRTASHDFPDVLQLTSIEVNDEILRLNWHRGNDRWIHVPEKDYRQEEDSDLYEYRAFRQRSNRTVVRFEWQFRKPYCAALIQLPHEGNTHEDCLREVWDALRQIGLCRDPPKKVALSKSVNAFSADAKRITASGRTMRAEGGHVDFVSTIPDRGIADIEALRTVSSAVDVTKFRSADGKFRLAAETHKELSRPINVDIFGSQSRIRITVQCRREDVYYLTDLVWSNNQTS